jgi:hypothetical protein
LSFSLRKVEREGNSGPLIEFRLKRMYAASILFGKHDGQHALGDRLVGRIGRVR